MFSVINYEARQSLSKMYVIPILIILALALGFVQYHVSEYKRSLGQKAVFQKVEIDMVNIYATYRHYATYGFRVMFLPAPISILFTNSTVLQDMTANVFPGHRLHIYQSLKGRSTFKINKYLFADYSGIFLFFGSLIALFYGYVAFLHTEYLRFLASITGKKKLFISIFLGRSIVLAFFTLLFLASAILVISINGVAVGIDRYLVLLFIKMYLLSLSFLFLGSVFGSNKSIIRGLAGSLTSWFLLLFIAPFLVGIIVDAKSDSIKPENQLEIEKLKLVMDFEKRSNEKAGILELNQKPADIDREIILNYYKNEFQKIQALEDGLKTQMQANTDLYYRLSSFFPTTGYLALTNEISSKGYETLYTFYQSVKQIKEAFFKEYMKQVYFSSQPPKVEPFLKGDDNIFIGKPALPGYLLLGFIFNILWIVGFAILAYYRFKKMLSELPEMDAIPVPTTSHIKIKKEIINAWHVDEDYLNNYLYNLLSDASLQVSKKTYPFTATLNGQPWDAAAGRQNFLYLCHPKEFPRNVEVGNFIDLIMNLMDVPHAKKEEIIGHFSLEPVMKKRFGRLNRDEMGQVILAILEMKSYDFYLINNIGRKMYWEFCYALVEKMHALSEAGATILFLTEDAVPMDRGLRKRVYCYESQNWIQNVTDLKNLTVNPETDE